MSYLSALAFGVALASSTACSAVSVRALITLREHAPPSVEALEARALEEAGGGTARYLLESEKRSAAHAIALLALRPRSMARIALASGTATSLLALADAITTPARSALWLGLGCFIAGCVAALTCMQLGRSASIARLEFRDEWNRRCAEATRRLTFDP
jgi:hypothetical protein